MSDSQNPNPNQVMNHDLTFAYTAPAPALSGCNLNLKYHCFNVSGLPVGKTASDLATQLKGLFISNQEVYSLTRVFAEGDKLCIDPDGTGDDQTGGGSTGGSTCVDGTMAISHNPNFVNNCCAVAAGNGFLVQNATNPNYMSCKLTNMAAGKVASATSSAAGFTADLATDADLNTMWKANDANPNHWLKVDLGVATSIKGVSFKFEAPGAYGYKVETSTNNVTWNLKKTGTSVATASSQDANFATTSARYVRVTLTSLPAGKVAALGGVLVYN
jgi:hypothetical protein